MNYKVIIAALAAGLSAQASAESVVLECEQFNDLGGWSVDSQFRLEMGSSYLLAHGLGKPVADAHTSFTFEPGGECHAWVRTKNWSAKWSEAEGAGRFQLIVNGKTLPLHLGVQGQGEWLWVDAGRVDLRRGKNTLALHDLTGFDGRVDAICFATDGLRPNRQEDRSAAADSVKTDITVVGGGIAGICAAISAARLGLKVALVQDRPMLGGANSSEVRVHLGGHINLGPYPRLGDVVAEIGPATGGNARPAANYEDSRKLKAVQAESNISLFLNTMVDNVLTQNGSISSVVGVDVITGKRTRFVSPLYVDCTGDAAVGALAGADWRLGRESRKETGESMAPEDGDRMTLGVSVQWYASNRDPQAVADRPFPREGWMIAFNEQNCEYSMRGDWDWETGMLRDQLHDFETIRDYGLLVVYSNWSYIKNRGEKKDRYKLAELDWVAHVAGKRETRRLMGDHVLCQQDVFEERPYPDGTCCTTWPVDLHFPMPSSQCHFEGEPFRSVFTHNPHYAYPIPYRCFYSRNIGNLFMAGRDISVTHVALGTTRVMRTHGMMGEVVGMAASLCKKHSCSPREIYTSHLDELKALMGRGVGLGAPQPPQTYNDGLIFKH